MLSQEKIISHRRLDARHGLYQLVLRGGIAATAQPGQFVHLKVGTTTDPLLRRPISIARIDRVRGDHPPFTGSRARNRLAHRSKGGRP